jgi:hypothetical protein
MLRRLLYIATIVFLVLCVALMGMWVRSYWWWDRCYVPGKQLGMQLNSDAGHVVVMVGPTELSVTKAITGHLPSSGPADPFYDNDILGFYFGRTSNGLRLDIPYWFMVLLSTGAIAISWLPWWSNRFSLRTLLITTTIVAIVLGMIAWLDQAWMGK